MVQYLICACGWKSEPYSDDAMIGSLAGFYPCPDCSEAERNLSILGTGYGKVSHIRELKGANISLVVKDNNGYRCKLHGSLTKVSKFGIYRCITTYSRTKDNDCGAGCIDVSDEFNAKVIKNE